MSAGYSPALYHGDCVNHCPGCGKTHWEIRRVTAECCFCGTAMMLTDTGLQPMAPVFTVTCSRTAELTQRTQ